MNLKKAKRKKDSSSNQAKADKDYKKLAEKEYGKYSKQMDKLELDAEQWAKKENYNIKFNPDGVPQSNSKFSSIGDRNFPTFRLRSSLISLGHVQETNKYISVVSHNYNTIRYV